MKKIVLSAVVAASMVTFATAGGDIAPVEPAITTPEVAVAPASMAGNFYIGTAYSYLDGEGKKNCNKVSDNAGAGTLLAGYKFNDYIALEGRYTDDFSDFSNWGIYAKPMYPVGPVSIYGLLGYGVSDIDAKNFKAKDDGFQWGAGLAYAVTQNIGLFADYVQMVDKSNFDKKDIDVKIYGINAGVTYTF